MPFLRCFGIAEDHPNRPKKTMQGGFRRRFTGDIPAIYCSAAIPRFGQLGIERIYQLYQLDRWT
jgi:hypothetical protein